MTVRSDFSGLKNVHATRKVSCMKKERKKERRWSRQFFETLIEMDAFTWWLQQWMHF